MNYGVWGPVGCSCDLLSFTMGIIITPMTYLLNTDISLSLVRRFSISWACPSRGYDATLEGARVTRETVVNMNFNGEWSYS